MPAHRYIPVMAVTLALTSGILPAGGCVVIVPRLPSPVPGYGQDYELVDQQEQPLAVSGMLLLNSGWRLASTYPIESGRASVPPKRAAYFAHMGIGGMTCPIPFGYVGEFRTFDHTVLYALVPGHVPAAFKEDGGNWYRRTSGEPLGVQWKRPGSNFVATHDEPLAPKLRMRQAPADLERFYLEYLFFHVPKPDVGGEKAEDQAAIERARRYMQDRLKELDAKA